MLEECAGSGGTNGRYFETGQGARISAAPEQLFPEDRHGVLAGEDQPVVVADMIDGGPQRSEVESGDLGRGHLDHVGAELAQLLAQGRRLLGCASHDDPFPE